MVTVTVNQEHTMKTLPFLLAEQIEMAIDSSNVASVLEYLAEVCRDKSQHISENWQDQALARAWDTSASDISKLAAKFRCTGIPGVGR